jgi:hypothetical protein
MGASAVMTEIFREGLKHIDWNTRINWNTRSFRNSSLEFNYSSDYSEVDFEHGIFAGISVDELFEAEPVGNVQNWYQCIEDIIVGYHEQILKTLKSEEEYRTSKEAYKEWLANENY